MRNRLTKFIAIALLFGAGCATGSATTAILKARAVAADGIVLAGETFLLTGAAYNGLCPAAALSLENCRGFRKFAEDKFKPGYPVVAKAYQDNKEVATEVAAQAAELLSGLTSFTKAANTALGVK